ncbi:short-chain fatty acyl-CoA regulator family protein [Pelagibius sp. Alg239-R121]|uniref:helix-turn-helix domain-containing protein n=1 Tax=Pelagibius sp. Alg239-R121 TaxID=2993448 RepID=UPI0024A60C4D|nr:helix-turn-helix transcriptional regulator [Pelagibius sp. Alg239-R121]
MRARKLFVGRQIKEIRQANTLTQAAFADRLGISTSYLNQLENNQRHITAPVLLSLAEAFTIDISSLSEHDDDRLIADMAEAVADPLLGGQQPTKQDLKVVVQNAPTMARAFLSMHQALRRAGEQLAELDETLERSGALNEPTPYEEVRDFFHYRDNYIHDLDLAAEKLANELAGGSRNRVRVLADYVERRHRVRVVIGNDTDAPGAIRRYDPTGRVLTLNPTVTPSTHAFQIAHQIAILEHSRIIDSIVETAEFRSQDAAPVCRIGLANYFAGSALLPYETFAGAARELKHDLDLLGDRFGASHEQVAHRLSTLQRPGQKGVPFFFARVDQAGTITKRHSATKLQFARFGSACPLWNVHRAFETPTRIIRQLAETPDGMRYLCLAMAVTKRGGGFRDPAQRYALALGCEIKHASELVYADDLDLEREQAFEPIGISCRICERRGCHQRAVPPLKRALEVDPNVRNTIPYAFR